MNNNNILGISIQKNSPEHILEEIYKYTVNPTDFFHIVSLNPENLVTAQTDDEFKWILNSAQIKIVDGIGVLIAGQLLQIDIGMRIPGVDLMQTLLESVQKEPLRVLFLGGRPNLAHQLAECYSKRRTQNQFKGTMGYENISHPTEDEERAIITIITDYKPHLIFASFGSPNQEKWFWNHRGMLNGTIGMGVGGGFDFLAGQVTRAPQVIRSFGLEWLFRLFIQPWRLKRQLRLITFIFLVIKQRFTIK